MGTACFASNHFSHLRVILKLWLTPMLTVVGIHSGPVSWSPSKLCTILVLIVGLFITCNNATITYRKCFHKKPCFGEAKVVLKANDK